MNFSDLISWITGDLTPEESKLMRQAGSTVIFRGWLTFFSIMALGGLAWMGLPGFLRASDVDGKISQAVQPLSTSVAQLSTAVANLAAASNEQTQALLRVAITDGLSKMCHSPKSETRAIYRREVDEAQDRYRKLTGSFYPEHPCEDL